MIRLLLFLFLPGLLFPQIVPAQDFERLEWLENGITSIPVRSDAGSVSPEIHITDKLLRSAEVARIVSRLSEDDFRDWKPAGKNPHLSQPGDTMSFFVRDIAAEDTASRPVYDLIPFVLWVIEERFLLWVEVAELENGHVREEDLEALRLSLADLTPAGSINENAGIIVNDESVFGQPPDVDNSGTVDVLMTDIRDDWQPGGGFIAGFVDPLNTICAFPDADCPPDYGNKRDILHLDTTPGLFAQGQYLGTLGIERTAAHEYQHLIHLNYDFAEETFINEGLSEWAEVLNGFESRPVSYLFDSERYNVTLFRWSYGLDRDVFDDYERAGLFTNYLADRIGIAETGAITRTGGTGDEAYQAVLGRQPDPISLEDFLMDFHTANYLNGRDIDPRFEYVTPQRSEIGTAFTVIYDGRIAQSTPVTTDTVAAGAALYLAWNDVEDFSFSMDVDALELNQEATLRNRGRVRILLEYADGTVEWQDHEPQIKNLLFPGAFDRVTVIPAHLRPDEENRVVFAYSAEWGGRQTLEQTTVTYDTGVVSSDTNGAGGIMLEAYTIGAAARQANLFVIPGEATLTRVAVAPYYSNQFASNLPASSPRNFRLHVWANDSGVPGQELFSTVVNDPRINNGTRLNFHTIDLEDHEQALSNLPDSIFIGLTNAGDDENYLVMGVTPYEGPNRSFLNLPEFAPEGGGSWVPFPNITSDGDAIFEDRVLPIRATFLIPAEAVATEDDGTLPDRVSLSQNYPNPFNPSTTIRFDLAQTSQIHLACYDVLGRMVAVLVEGEWPAGRHEVSVDASSWTSGLYFYRLSTAAGESFVRQMMVLK